MQWRERLALLLGAASPFALGEAAYADGHQTVWLDGPEPVPAQKDLLVFVDPAQRERLLILAGHRSHSSHSSHRSHVSGGGGHSSHYSGTTYSAPVYSPPPVKHTPSTPKPAVQSLYSSSNGTSSSAHSSSSMDAVPGDTATPAKRYSKEELADIIQKVQIALIVRGFDPGPVDGVYSEKMKKALGQFQAANHLPVTNLMDLQTLKLLNVVQ